MRVKSLGYVAIQTRSLAAWDRFMTGVAGLMPASGAPDGVRLYRMDGRPFRFWIEEGPEERLLAPGWEFGSKAEFEMALDRLSAAGCLVEPLPGLSAARGVAGLARSSDPDGNVFELFYGDTRDDVAFVSPAGVPGFVTGENGGLGLGHVVIAAPNFAATHAFYKETLGFGDTDTPRFHLMGGPDDPGMGFAFLHADNGRHHSLALGEMPVPPSGCVHIMLEVASLDETGKAFDRMKAADTPLSASIGRHVNDEMVSFYMQTPGGFDLEFGYDGLVIDPKTWVPTAHQQISQWGHVWAWQEAMKAHQKAAE